ncbi:MAG: patatin-like phospholipase family protein [Chloroflexota bacterium]
MAAGDNPDLFSPGPLAGSRRSFLPAKGPPRVGLALGGGGARGLAHVGVLKVFEEHGLQVDVIAGTSMGGLVAVAAAGGVTVADMLAIAGRTRVMRLLGRDRTGLALANTDRVGAMIAAAVGVGRLEDLALPCAVVAADAVTGERVVIDTGSVARAVQATIAIPGVLSPICEGKRILIDGGVVEPVPVKTARALGATVVIAVNVSADPHRPLRDALGAGVVPPRLVNSLRVLHALGPQRMIDILVKAYEIQGAQLASAQLELDPPAIVIRPNLEGMTADRFEAAGNIIAAGEAAARAALPEIMRVMGVRG